MDLKICFGFLSKVGLIYDITSCIVVNPYSKIDSWMGLSVWFFACLVVVLLMFCWHAFCVLMFQFKIHMLGFSYSAINLTCHFSFVFYRPISCMDAWGAFPTFCATPNHIAPPKHRKWSTFLIAPPKKEQMIKTTVVFQDLKPFRVPCQNYARKLQIRT